MLAELKRPSKPADLQRVRHTLVVFPRADALPADLLGRDLLLATLRRRREKVADLAKSPACAAGVDGGLYVWAAFDPEKTAFERDTLLCAAVSLLLDEHPESLSIEICGDPALRAAMAERAAYAVWVNGTPLPAQRKEADKPLKRFFLSGWEGDLSVVAACAAGNVLARQLTVLPPNDLTPALYRKRIARLARDEGWEVEVFDFARLQKMGAGAFLAVAQGSGENDAAIVRVSYVPKRSRGRVALVGKGICFDTGGHNLKSAKSMIGMHEDMNGSAVVLGLLLAASRQKLPLRIDAWLAVAQNHLSPQAYKQGDIVRALNGTTIEVVHTDAEGRMVLADTLTLAAKGAAGKPDLIIDFATLTYDMIVALGTRYCGIFASDATLAGDAVAAGVASGERVCSFPFDADYEEDLESKVADIKQCSLEGEADHILAARFLKRFVGKQPWLHVDLSAASNEDGLGAVASDQTGFGVAWGLELLKHRLAAGAA
ncbi:MAG: leucyl aminopeptidase family protein [Rhodocyclaceae bacterium]